MEDKLQILAEKLVKEGVARAEAEQKVLLEAAQAEAKALVVEAQKQADLIVKQAKAEAERQQTSVQAELQTLSRRALEGLKADLRHLIVQEVIQLPMQQALRNNLLPLLEQIVQKLYADEKGRLLLKLSPADASALSADAATRLQAFLQQQPEISSDAGIGSGFRVAIKDKRYVIDFTDEAFSSLVQDLMGEQLRQLMRHDA